MADVEAAAGERVGVEASECHIYGVDVSRRLSGEDRRSGETSRRMIAKIREIPRSPPSSPRNSSREVTSHRGRYYVFRLMLIC